MILDGNFTLTQLTVVFSLLGIILISFLHKLRFDPWTKVFYLLAFTLTFLQFATTKANQYAPDFSGHIGYISHIVRNLELPPPLGWQSQQPPLFYLFAAVLGKGGIFLGMSGLYCSRLAAVIFYYGAMIFSGLLLTSYIKSKKIYYLCLLVVLFWPAATHTSVKISNDVGQFFFAIGFVYFLTNWLNTKELNFLNLSIIFAGGAIATKSTGLLPVLVLCYFLIRNLVRNQIKPHDLARLGTALSACILISCLAINFARIWYWKEYKNVEINWIINRHDDYRHSWETVSNKPKNYLLLKLSEYFENPLPRFQGSIDESNYFWNVFLKTLLYDQKINYSGSPQLLRLINFSFLVYIVCLAGAIYAMRTHIFADDSISAIIIMLVFAIVMLMAARISVPVSYQGSARYIYLVIVLTSLLYGHLLSGLWEKRPRSYFARFAFAALVFFCFLTSTFSFTRWDWPIAFASLKAG